MRVLLVDHDSEGLEAIARAIRGVLELDCVSSKGDAMLLLRQNTYDVLIACERCVDGSGLDLLGRTTRTAAPLKRIFAAAPERLQLLGPRLAPFKVQRTINYPIDLEELWLAIAQVTGGPDDGTDGTIERVVLDERGIPSTGTQPRAPLGQASSAAGAPRPASISVAPPPAAPQLAAAISPSSSGRFATARMTQPAPEPPLRAPPPPRQPPQVRAPAPPATPSDTGRMRAATQPATTSDTGRMRALAPPVKPMPPMPVAAPLGNGAARDFPSWTPEAAPFDEDFAAVAAQARLGVQQKVVDEAARRRNRRLLTASIVAVAVAAGIVLLIEKFYDPEARAREKAIATEVARMAEQQKVTDDLTKIEVDIETAIMNNDLDGARHSLATLVEKSPNHPRREFLQDAIDRAAELSKLSPDKAKAPVAAQTESRATPKIPDRETSRPAETTGSRSTAHPTSRATEPAARTARDNDRSAGARTKDSSPPQRVFGAPLGEPPRQQQIPLNAPINAPPTTSSRSSGGSSFGGRTVEASDASSAAGAPAPAAPAPVSQPLAATPSTNTAGAGSAATPAPAAAPTVIVTPAKLVKRVTPIAPAGVSSRTSGYVLVRFQIGENGRVSDIAVVESSPPGVFDDAAQTAVRKWVYEPRKENGAAVASTAQAKLVFAAE